MQWLKNSSGTIMTLDELPGSKGTDFLLEKSRFDLFGTYIAMALRNLVEPILVLFLESLITRRAFELNHEA